MKKEIKIAVAVILSIWFFVMGFEIGTYKERKANIGSTQEVVNTVTPIQNTTTTVPTTIPTTVPTTIPTTIPPTVITTIPVLDPSTTAPTTGTAQPDATSAPAESTEAPTQNTNDPASLSKEQIVEKVNTYMSALKSEQNMTAHEYEDIKVNVVDCSVEQATSAINSIIESIAGVEEADHVFTGGKNANGETPFAIVPPGNKEFKLTDAGVVSATAKASGTDTVYTVVLAEEHTTAASPVPAHNSASIGYLDLTSLDLPGVTITEANMHYPGSTVEITVNADGKVTKMVNKIPMTGEGAAKITFFTGNASFEGSLNEEWTFTY